MTKIGVIAEDTSDIEVVKELIRKFQPPSSFCVRHFVGNGCGKLRTKSRAWADQLRLRGCSCLLFLHDLDRHNPSKLRSDLVAALSPCPIPKHAIVIPIEEIEAWLMCDPSAIMRVFSLRIPPKLPGNPESIVNPKEKLESLVWRLSGKRRRYINTVHNAAIAKALNISLLRKCSAFDEFERFINSDLSA